MDISMKRFTWSNLKVPLQPAELNACQKFPYMPAFGGVPIMYDVEMYRTDVALRSNITRADSNRIQCVLDTLMLISDDADDLKVSDWI
ncbi:hypothetical protein Tco_1283367 [Tanacetum coccineum]